VDAWSLSAPGLSLPSGRDKCAYFRVSTNFMTTTMKPVLFDYFKKTAKVLEANYDRSAEQNAICNLGKNRESFCNLFSNTALSPKLKTVSGEIWDSKVVKTGQHDLIIIRDDASSLEFGSVNTYLAEGFFSDSGFAGLAINITPLKFIPYV
jgi:hypothetical protein